MVPMTDHLLSSGAIFQLLLEKVGPESQEAWEGLVGTICCKGPGPCPLP